MGKSLTVSLNSSVHLVRGSRKLCPARLTTARVFLGSPEVSSCSHVTLVLTKKP